MPHTREGAAEIAARRLGLTYEDYVRRVGLGLKWCTRCRSWHPREHFAGDDTRSDGLQAKCRACDARLYQQRRARRGGGRSSTAGVSHFFSGGVVVDTSDPAVFADPHTSRRRQ